MTFTDSFNDYADRTMPHLFHEALITLNTKSDKDVTKKNTITDQYTESDTEILNEIPANRIQKCIH